MYIILLFHMMSIGLVSMPYDQANIEAPPSENKSEIDSPLCV